ncbi:hypothetical protein G7B40_008070 [Aetokthonos hydrillicola Thurmond2011]|uniref:Uncharacterized protein n=1 Tax=Aetokthonos hydrillicola Thurmond2011 TaxID=2712845 RepID=A0AAP5M9C0_9CYAN|nr:hypothetical protein [Aetokthonos hydrillicola CCALA 1050]MBW4585628.1 hypothetical protein [Aetokthonos hydrillicola CCALA 1050]MDR9894528.1 hypothetical protein [Aetokthonos hydrillicola Thurmond2011]
MSVTVNWFNVPSQEGSNSFHRRSFVADAYDLDSDKLKDSNIRETPVLATGKNLA